MGDAEHVAESSQIRPIQNLVASKIMGKNKVKIDFARNFTAQEESFDSSASKARAFFSASALR